MDPLTQGVIGCLAARTFVGRKRKKSLALAIMGGLSALTPDLDVLIKSPTDHLLFLEYHRQFTHSLFFIPFGGLLCAMVMWPFVRFKRICSFKICFSACLIGYATHGVIDACTTYGTVLFWPFFNTRIAWSAISIIDPIFTSIIILGLILSIRKSSILLAQLLVLFVVFYLSLGFYQKQRVQSEVYQIATNRGHLPERVFVKPSFGNLVVWRTVYLYDDRFYVDAIRAGRKLTKIDGGFLQRFNVNAISEKTVPPIQLHDLRRFNWFTSNMLGVSEFFPNRVQDVRYALLPNSLESIWYLEFDEDKKDNKHLSFNTTRGNAWEKLKILLFMVFGFTD